MLRPTHSFAWLVSCLLALAACSSGPAGDAAPSAAGYTALDDMEGNGGHTWWSGTDCTEGDRIAPISYVNGGSWSFATLPAPRETVQGVMSTRAARLRTAAPIAGIWGAVMGFDFASSPPPAVGPPAAGAPCKQPTALDFPGTPVDLTAYSGVTFWGMADPAGEKVILVQLQDRNTDPRGGVCNAADPSTEGDCDNGFGTRVELTDTFTQYTVDFSSLYQNPTWGYHPNPRLPDLAHVYSLSFQVTEPGCGAASATYMCAGGNAAPVSFDFWIDDLYLVNK